ncbi:MAG: serine hydroxymethyltransferase [Melioribacteraceae bacterium]|nr:serine hydroxymethyltransferase [Melioribacteraceae bacterium]MCF8354400.1 serine hydroxymethyltransferase [Melioribacteraceae bacterium]MCF8393003.1 serine hydroxymethyltransferase [Melioribacteraceae bacterium]MCF8417254.1 serine hydroxymethyltransferase [Melioribacteraceae bacterium]
MLQYLNSDPEVLEIAKQEIKRQQNYLELIASENFVSMPVLAATGSVLTNKYAEGYPGKRYYGGCEYVDMAEDLARERLKELFDAEYVNVQPHSGSQANMAVYMALLNPGDTILGLSLDHGGHLTHGSFVNFSGKIYRSVGYTLNEETKLLDYNIIEDLAKKEKPKLIVAGASAYSRDWDYAKFREIADSVGALLMTDMAHPSGLIAKGLLTNPLPYCDVVTSTTHKTLRGPRGGIILVGKDKENPIGIKTFKGDRLKLMSEVLDSIVMPGIQGGPLMHVIMAKALAFGEALQDSFGDYAKQVISNAHTLSAKLINYDFEVISGGTDNHLMLIDLTNKNISGKKAEKALELAGVTVNKNMIPFDTKSPFVTSGIRVGTAAVTTRGMKETEMEKIADFINSAIINYEDESKLSEIKSTVESLCSQFPLYPELVS